MNPVQKATLRKAAVWFAALLTLMQCGWIVFGCALSLASGSNQMFLDLSWMGTRMVIGILLFATVIGYAQIVAVRTRNWVVPILLGAVFLALGSGVLLFAVVTGLFAFSWAGVNGTTILVAIIPFIPTAVWLFTGVAMVWQASYLTAQRFDHIPGRRRP